LLMRHGCFANYKRLAEDDEQFMLLNLEGYRNLLNYLLLKIIVFFFCLSLQIKFSIKI
jgi:hypothetical protein